MQRMLSEYIPLADAAKVKAMGKGAKYFYLFFIGTDPSQRRKGHFPPYALVSNRQHGRD